MLPYTSSAIRINIGKYRPRGDATTPVLSQPRVRNSLKSAIVVLYAGLEQSKRTMRQHLSEYHPKTKRALIGLEPWQREDRAMLRACSGSRLTCAERNLTHDTTQSVAIGAMQTVTPPR
ncbi:hypothetical protein J6590_087577 [Homalodisca vitripennis]|nr:hypothetical protein J6590_087577 [Homalodisca vitripennis]